MAESGHEITIDGICDLAITVISGMDCVHAIVLINPFRGNLPLGRIPRTRDTCDHAHPRGVDIRTLIRVIDGLVHRVTHIVGVVRVIGEKGTGVA